MSDEQNGDEKIGADELLVGAANAPEYADYRLALTGRRNSISGRKAYLEIRAAAHAKNWTTKLFWKTS